MCLIDIQNNTKLLENLAVAAFPKDEGTNEELAAQWDGVAVDLAFVGDVHRRALKPLKLATLMKIVDSISGTYENF